MFGKYIAKTQMGDLLFEIDKTEKGISILMDSIAAGMKFRPVIEKQDGNTMYLKIVIPMMGDHESKLKMEWMDGYYEVNGNMAIVGEVNFKAELFTGKTAYETMLEELPNYRTGKVVNRSEEEIEAAVEELLAKMTLEEKIGQMSQSGGSDVAAIGGSVNKKMTDIELIEAGLMGSMISMASLEVAFHKQKIAVEKSRLGIPLLFCQDVIHGYDTIFPIPLGWSCSFRPELVQNAMQIAAKEATTQGIKMGFSPMLDIARDPRWGRVAEGNGEDPYLCSRMCEAHVKGFQGENLNDTDTLLACLKHFVGYSAAEGGRDYNTAEITKTTLYNTYLPPFQAGIDAGAASIMNSFNVMDSVPVVINKKVCRDILRDEMNFDGILISDYGAVSESIVHGAAEDGKDAAVKAVKASLDIEMATTNYLDNLAEAVREGLLKEELIDEGVRRILTYKYKSGIMDDPFRYFQPEKSDIVFSKEHLEASYELARESIVLLKNSGILPLAKDKKVALIGPKADSTDLLGTWQFSKHAEETVTLKQGLEACGVTCVYEKGCGIEKPIEGGVEKALEVARNSELIILALGESMGMSGEAASRQHITIPDVQMELAYELKKLGKPIILVLTNGRPLLLEWFEENVEAIVETWFLGSQAGRAIADTLIGNYNPSGKLSISFPRNHGQIPVYYNHLNTGRPYAEGSTDRFVSKYLDGSNDPLYFFGYGLSYTNFDIKDLKLSSNKVRIDEEIKVSVSVQNVGEVEGTETIQLYIRDIAAQISRPVKELKGFQKISLLPGQSEEVTFSINSDLLSYYNQEGKKVTDPGKFEIFVGTSSRDMDLLKEEMILN